MISELAFTPIGLYVKKGGPFDIPLKELIQKAKEKPNTIKVGIGGHVELSVPRYLPISKKTAFLTIPALPDEAPLLRVGHVKVD